MQDGSQPTTWLAFIPVWLTLVYLPVAHWMWGGGWLAQMGALDFAGGIVVHDLTKKKLDVHSSAPVIPTVARETKCMVDAVENLLKIISPYQYHQNKCALEVVTLKSSAD